MPTEGKANAKAADDATDELNALRAEVARLQAVLGEALDRKEHSYRLEDAIEDAEEFGEQIQDHVVELRKQIDAHPLQSTLIALGLGFLLGRILSR